MGDASEGGNHWAFLRRDGSEITGFSSHSFDIAPQMRALVGSYNWDDPVRKQWRPVLGTWAPDGTSTMTFLDRFMPLFGPTDGTLSSLPPPAVGVALGVTEINQLTGGWRVMVWIVDERGSVCGVPWEGARANDNAFPVAYLGVDPDLNVLVYYEGNWLFAGPQFARWYTIDGTPLTDEFPAPTGRADCKVPGTPGAGVCDSISLVSLIGGGFAYEEGYQWRAFFPSREARMEPAPAWLQDYNGHELHRIGDRGYVAVPVVGLEAYHVPTADHLDFISATGESCGTMMLESPLTRARIYVGRDGTVFQSSWLVAEKCQLPVWDRLLQ